MDTNTIGRANTSYTCSITPNSGILLDYYSNTIAYIHANYNELFILLAVSALTFLSRLSFVCSQCYCRTVQVWVKRENGQYWPSISYNFDGKDQIYILTAKLRISYSFIMNMSF